MKRVLPVVVALPWVLLVWRFWFLCDDAYITFRYARHLANGHGLVFNLGETSPVEGFSNLGWLLVAAAVEGLGGSVERVMPVLSTASAAGVLVLVWRMSRRLGTSDDVAAASVLILAASPPMGVWSSSGLEVMPQTLLVLLLVDALIVARADRRAALAAAALIVLRVDGWVWVGAVAAAAAAAAGVRPRGRVLAPAAAVLVGVIGWRWATFGTFVPHIAAVKVDLDPQTLLRGVRYVASGWVTLLVPAVILFGSPRTAIRRWGGPGLGLVLAAWIAPVLAVVATGDFLPFWRLLVPGLPIAAVLFGASLEDLRDRRGRAAVFVMAGILAVVGASPAVHGLFVPDPLPPMFEFRQPEAGLGNEIAGWDQTVRNTREFVLRGRALRQVARPGDAVVAAGVGAVGYFADDLVILDRCGLVDAEVGLRPRDPGSPLRSPGHDKLVPAEFFVKDDPRFLQARVVVGPSAGRQMATLLDGWDVDPTVRDRYVPDWYVSAGRRFLLVVRRIEPGEDAALRWAGLPRRLEALP